jgi:hypothetical protein
MHNTEQEDVGVRLSILAYLDWILDELLVFPN